MKRMNVREWIAQGELYEEALTVTQSVINDTMNREDIVICSCTGPDYDMPFAGMKMLMETESTDKEGNSYAIQVLRKDAYAVMPVDDVMEYYLARCNKEDELDVFVVVEEDLFGLHSDTYEVPYTCDGCCREARIFFIRRVNDASVKEEHAVLYEHALNMLHRRSFAC